MTPYTLLIEKDGITGSWVTVADSATEAILRTLALGVNVLGWELK